MASEQARVECLHLAHERLGPDASHEALWRELSILVALVDGYEPAKRNPDGTITLARNI